MTSLTGIIWVMSFLTSITVEASTNMRIPVKNLTIPEEMQSCAENLRRIHAAIKAYEKHRGELPNWLSDLVPCYLSREALQCPTHPNRTRAPYYPDRNSPCGYTYEFSPTRINKGWLCRDWKKQQLRQIGDVVPIVRCIVHGTNTVLNVSVGGQIYWSALPWEHLFTHQKPRESEPDAIRFTIPPENLVRLNNVQACVANLQRVYRAIRKFEMDKGRLPNRLSELVPEYVCKDSLWCPNEHTHPEGRIVYAFTSGRVSNDWPVIGGMRFCDWKKRQVEVFGDVVPIIRCHGHGSQYLNVSVSGKTYISPLVWERMFIPDYTHGDEFRGAAQYKTGAKMKGLTIGSTVVASSSSDRIFLLDGSFLNGEPVTSVDNQITVSPGEKISGILKIRVENDHDPGAVVPVIYTPSWGDHSSSSVCIKRWAPTGTSYYDASVSLTAPKEGTHYIIFGSQGQTDGCYIASLTGWFLGHNSWNDGTDLADMNEVDLGDCMTTGFAALPVLEKGGVYKDCGTGCTYVKVKVTGENKEGRGSVHTRGDTGSPDAKPGAAKSRIPAENLKVPEELKNCAVNLKKIHAAIEAYEKDKGDLPNWLSDLVPDYLSPKALICPIHPDRTRAPYCPDCRLPCSYTYEFSPTRINKSWAYGAKMYSS